MIRPDNRQMVALARLSATADGEVLKQLLDTELSRLKTFLVDCPPETIARQQGYARCLTETIALLRDAAELAHKAR